MKKNLFMVAAVALMAMVSCNKEEIVNNGVEGGQVSDIVFSAELEQPDGGQAVAPAAAQTKTSLGEAVDGVRPVTWNAGDQIKVNGVEFSAVEAGARTYFTTTASFTEAETYYAVYPASATNAADHSAITIPASQKGTFAEASISVAESATQSLSFKNVASILKFQVPAACSEVTIESTSNLAGTFPVTFTNDLPVIGTVSNGSKKITLTGSFVTGTDYYAAVLPGSHTFTIRLDGYLSKASTTAVTTGRAVLSNLKEFPAPVASNYGLVGVFNSWNTNEAIWLYVDVNNTFLIKDQPFINTEEFKVINKNGSNTTWYGASSSLSNGTAVTASTSGNNIKVQDTGCYDIKFDASTSTKKVSGTKVADLKSVIVTVKNTTNWTTVYSHLWVEGSTDTDITKWPGNKLTLSNGEALLNIDIKHVGKSIGYILHNNAGKQTLNGYFKVSSARCTISTELNVYLSPGVWENDGAWFAICLCNGSSSTKWIKMVKDGDYYKATLPVGENHKNILFVRMNKAATALDWSSKWNQSDDLTFDGNHWTVSAWGDGNSPGNWSIN